MTEFFFNEANLPHMKCSEYQNLLSKELSGEQVATIKSYLRLIN